MNTGFKLAGLAAVSLALSGCVNLSGYDAADKFACKAPDGVLCESMTGIYANAKENNLPGQRVTHAGGAGVAKSVVPAAQSGVITKPIYSGTPVRTAPRVLRLWFAPWEDQDGDLHDQNYVYMQVDTGRWLIEHNRRRIQDAYRPVSAPSVSRPTVVQPQQSQGGVDSNVFIAPVQGRQGDGSAMDGIRAPSQMMAPSAVGQQ